jgi:hypothetical protein
MAPGGAGRRGPERLAPRAAGSYAGRKEPFFVPGPGPP